MKYLEPALLNPSTRAPSHLPDASGGAADRTRRLPICGMGLEPLMVSASSGPNHELIDMTRRFWIGLVLALPVFVLEMGGHLFGFGHLISSSASNVIQLLLATPVVLGAGWPFFTRAWQSLLTRNLNMFTLIAMGTGVAWGYSMLATLHRGYFPQHSARPTEPWRFILKLRRSITVLVVLGQVLKLRARESTGGAIRALLDLAPKSARRNRRRRSPAGPFASATNSVYYAAMPLRIDIALT